MAFCAIWALWLSFLYGALGPHSYVQIHDNGDSFLPARAGMYFSVPGWNATTAWAHSWLSGVDRGITGLETVPFVFLPGWLAYWLVMFAQRLVAAYFGYRLARDRWDVAPGGAWFLALSYSLFYQPAQTTISTGWVLYDAFTLAAIPVILWVLLAKDMRAWKQLLLAAGVGILYAWTSQYPFAAFVLVLLAVVMIAWAGRRGRLWLAFVVFLVCYFAAEIPSILTGVMNTAASQRAHRAAFSPLTRGLWSQTVLAAEVVRDNVLGLILCLWGLWVRRDRRSVVLFAAFVVGAILVALANYAQHALETYGGPLRGFEFARFYIDLPFLAAAVGAIGIGTLRHAKARMSHIALGVAMAIVLVISLAVNVRMVVNLRAGSTYEALFENPALQTLSEMTKDEEPFRVATVVASGEGHFAPQPGFEWALGIDTADGYVVLYSQRYQDFWGRVIGPLLNVDSDRNDYFHYWGNRAYLFAPTHGFPKGPVQVSSYYDLNLLALANVRYLVSAIELADPRLTEVIGPAGKSAPNSGVKQEGSLYLYQLADTLPRAFVATSTRSFATRAELLDALAAAPPTDLRQTAFFEQIDGQIPVSTGSTGKAEPVKETADGILVNAEASGSGCLIVTEEYSRFWKARVDGAAVKILPVDGAFMAVPLQPGRHVVVLSYDPPYAVPFLD